jgi:hypothetical protein
MDLGGFTSQICKEVNTTDEDSRAVCAHFVDRWYKYIATKFDWRDCRRRDEIASVAGIDNVALPTTVDRIISIRYGDHFLDPVDDTFYVESDPTIFERTGIPQAYQEFTEDDGTRKIRLYPMPAVDGTMLIIGKRKLPDLTADSDVPILRGIDEPLYAFGLSEMLRYHKQYAKADQIKQEANALLDNAIALEKQQTNVPRRTKALTVTGDSLAEMTDAVCARIGQWQPDAVIMIREFIRRCYVQTYNNYLWPESLVMARVDSDGAVVVLPWYMCAVISVRADTKGVSVDPEELSTYFSITPDIFEQKSGWPVAYSILTPVSVARLPPIAERLAFVSSDMNDSSQIMVRGESSGDIISESISLNGTSLVYTEHPYTAPLTTAKGITLGNITIRGASSNVVLGELRADERERKRMRLWIQPNSDTPHRCLVLGKRTIRPLVQDEDTPAIRNIGNYLIHCATSEAFANQGNQQAAADYKAKAAESLQGLIDLEVRQNSVGPRVIPWVASGYDYDDSSCDFLSDKAFVTP